MFSEFLFIHINCQAITTQVIILFASVFTSVCKGNFILLLVAKEAKPFLFKQKETKVNPGTLVFYSASPSLPARRKPAQRPAWALYI